MKISVLIAALSSVVLMGCTDLNEVILNEQSGKDLASDPANALMLISPAYSNVREIYFKAFGLSTDEVCLPARGTDWKSEDSQLIVEHDFRPVNTNFRYIWRNATKGISTCNTAMLYLSALPQTDEIKQYYREMVFLRAYQMFILVDAFGQVPMREYDETDYSQFPVILNRKQACERIEKDLLEIIPEMKQKGEVVYGHATKAAAQALLAKLYLNYQVFTGTSPLFADGTARWSDVVSVCDQIINSKKYVLADDWWSLFSWDNAAYGNATETIFPLVNDKKAGVSGDSWISNVLHYNQVFGPYTGLNNGYCTTSDFLNTWDVSDPRFSDNRMKSQTGFNLGFLEGQQYSPKGVALLTRGKKPLIFTREITLYNCPEEGGVRVVKYSPNMGTNSSSGSDNDIQCFRLTDVYLMRAEAKLRGGDVKGALQDLNEIRTVRKVLPVQESELTLDRIYNERGYEFYWEGANRRQDMIRFGHFFEPRTLKPKQTEAYKNVYPIPLEALEGNKQLKQNTGY